MKKTLLKTENLSKTFSNGGQQQHVLKNINMELYEGDFTVIMGASGAGKSTLLYALSGMDTPASAKYFLGTKLFPICRRTVWRCSGETIAVSSFSRYILSTE